MSNQAQLDAERFRRLVLTLAKHANVSPEAVIEAEAAKILEGALRFTRVAKASSIRNRLIQRFESRKFLTLDGKRYSLENRYPDEVWSRVEDALTEEYNALEERIKERLKRRGIAKQSWWLLARKLGMDIKAPAFVKKAQVNGVDLSSNVRFGRQGSGRRSVLTLVNSSPPATSKGGKGHDALRKAFRGRLKFFERNVKEGVFDKVKTLSAAYPGITIKR